VSGKMIHRLIEDAACDEKFGECVWEMVDGMVEHSSKFECVKGGREMVNGLVKFVPEEEQKKKGGGKVIHLSVEIAILVES
jgi:hypothetical protein